MHKLDRYECRFSLYGITQKLTIMNTVDSEIFFQENFIIVNSIKRRIKFCLIWFFTSNQQSFS